MSKKAASSIAPLHICFVAHEYHDDFVDPAALLDAYHTLTDWCEALQQHSCMVSAVVRFKIDTQLKRKGIHYHFVQDAFGPQLKFWQIPRKMHQVVLAQNADLVHVHNFNKVLQHRDLAHRLQPHRVPLLVQNHGESPRFWLRNIVQRQVFSQIDAFLFCALGQEQIWQQRKIFTLRSKLLYVMEGSSYFQKRDRRKHRAETGLQGQPVILWVGHLNSNKDPLTILQAFAQIRTSYPKAQLYMIYREAQLLPAIQTFLKQNETLRNAVHLLGEKPRAKMEAFYNSADYFLLGSHREGSGYAALEAIACGCIPILTNIHSYRMMTDQGRIGPLWIPADVSSLHQAMQKAFAMPIEQQSNIVRQFFESKLSYPAIAKTMIAYYQALANQTKSE